MRPNKKTGKQAKRPWMALFLAVIHLWGVWATPAWARSFSKTIPLDQFWEQRLAPFTLSQITFEGPRKNRIETVTIQLIGQDATVSETVKFLIDYRADNRVDSFQLFVGSKAIPTANLNADLVEELNTNLAALSEKKCKPKKCFNQISKAFGPIIVQVLYRLLHEEFGVQVDFKPPKARSPLGTWLKKSAFGLTTLALSTIAVVGSLVASFTEDRDLLMASELSYYLSSIAFIASFLKVVDGSLDSARTLAVPEEPCLKMIVNKI